MNLFLYFFSYMFSPFLTQTNSLSLLPLQAVSLLGEVIKLYPLHGQIIVHCMIV